MFGIFRTLLALGVVVAHLLRFQSLGEHAVHGFFILSGYLMTIIMHQSYGYSLRGVAAFALNRFLRLYPSYWAILLFILITCLIVGKDLMADYHDALRFPSGVIEWLENIFFIYPAISPSSVSPRLSPATWALTVELFYYTLIAVGASRSRRLSFVWIGISFIYLCYSHITGLGYDSRYLWIPAASLPFALGTLCYHFQDSLKSMVCRVNAAIALVGLGILFISNAIAAAAAKQFLTGDAVRSICAYINLPIVFLAICILMTKPKFYISDKMDKIIGDFSYPLYLVHWQSGLLASFLLYGKGVRGHSLEGLLSFSLALLISIVVSGFIVVYLDPLTENIRSRIKLGIRG